MNRTLLDNADVNASRSVEPLDSATPAEQMRAIDEGMQHYFGSEDWLRERNKAFPGLS